MNKKVIFLFCFVLFVIFQSKLFSVNYENLLDKYLLDRGYERIEGHSCANNTTQPDFFKKLIKSNPSIKIVGEIGFNAGHSSVLFLESNPKVKVYSFDIINHDYVWIGKKFIDTHFPNRHVLIAGSSIESVPQFNMKNENIKFDLIFIDGGHTFEIALKDIINMKNLSHKNTIVIVDDLSISGVKNAFEKCVEMNIISRGNLYRSKHKAWSVCKYIFKSTTRPSKDRA